MTNKSYYNIKKWNKITFKNVQQAENDKKFVNKDHVIHRAQKGDQNAFRELMDMLEPRIARTVYGMLGPGHEAEDVGQETFIRLFRALPDFRGESTIETYATRIAINLSLNEIKRRKRFWRIFTEVERPDERVSGYQVRNDEKTDLVLHEALKKIKPDQKAVIVLRYMDGLSTRETAEILGIPEGTVLSRLSRAQEKLKKILKPVFGK